MAEWMIASLILTALLLVIEHWFPAPVRWHVIVNYVLGVLAILAGQSLWLYKSGRVEMICDIWPFAIVGGLTVLLCYGIDWLLNTWVKARTHGKHTPEPPKG